MSRTASNRPHSAVIDIGSNTVRLVIYSGHRRAPVVWLNEKVAARLGRDLAVSGLLPEKAMACALAALARYAALLEDVGVRDVRVAATAAVREAANGGQFVEQVRQLGLPVQVLSGEEEALISAEGVLGAFPDAAGVVADLGGGSLELTEIGDGSARHGVSLALGTLRLAGLRAAGPAAMESAVTGELQRCGWAAGGGGPLYMVGGTWRAFASFAMHELRHPLSDPQAFRLDTDNALRLARKIARTAPEKLALINGVPASRAAGLPDAAAMLQALLRQLQPDALVFSSWGLREGLLLRQLSPLARRQDPLLAAVAHFADPRGGPLALAVQVAGWTVDAAQGTGNGSERLRLAATMLALAAARLEPNMRLDHACDWALHKRWPGLDHAGRAQIAAALRASCGKPEPSAPLLRLASLSAIPGAPDPESALRESAAWGLALRLCRRFGAATPGALLASTLSREGNLLVLKVAPARSQLLFGSVENDLKSLAQWLGLGWSIKVE